MFSKFFIDRPIFATVLALLIVVGIGHARAFCPLRNTRHYTAYRTGGKGLSRSQCADVWWLKTVSILVEQQVNRSRRMLLYVPTHPHRGHIHALHCFYSRYRY